MYVSVRYQSDTQELQLKSATVKHLMSTIEKKMKVPLSDQVLIFRGRKLSSKEKKKLPELGIKDGSKILLVSHTEKDEEPLSNGGMRTRSKTKPVSDRGREIAKPSLDDPPHISIIAQGPPPGCLKGEKNQVNQFPKKDFTHFIVYNTEGALSKLFIESDGLWIETDGRSERIFISDIKGEGKGVQCEDIPVYKDEYIAVHLFLNSDVRRTFYFVPKQFQKLIEDHLRS